MNPTPEVGDAVILTCSCCAGRRGVDVRKTVDAVTVHDVWAVIAASAAITQWLDEPGEP